MCRHGAQGYTRHPAPFKVSPKIRPKGTHQKHLFTTVLVTAAYALPLQAAAQARYPALSPDQLTPAQKAYIENLAKPPRNNTTALKNPPFKVYLRSPELAAKLPRGGVRLCALG